MTRPGKSLLRFALPLLTAAVFLSTFGVVSQSTQAQCPRPGFKLNYGHFAYQANKIVTADFNSDGKTDIAAAFYGDGIVGIYFGNGAGDFSAPVTYPVGSSITRMLTADVNNDTKPDLIFGLETFTQNRLLVVLLNNGSGAFGSGIANSYPFDAFTMKTGDLNGDGKTDMIFQINGTPGLLSIRLGDGLGNFPSVTNYPGTDFYRYVPGDFNGDGKLDVAVYRSVSMLSKVQLYLNDGAGGLVPGTETNLDNASVISLARDFNGDGKLDLAGYSFVSGSAALILLNNGSGGFNRTDYPIATDLGGVRAGDFNGDGKVDLLGGGFSYLDKSVTIYGNGTGGFTQGEIFSTAYGWNDQGEIADFNGDGKSDLAVAIGSGVRTFVRTCNDVSNTKRIDYDGDALGDFAVWRPSTGDWIIDQSATNTRRTVRWGGGSFGDVPVPGDYDGDGKSDIAVFRAPTGAWYVLKSSDNTLFGAFWGTAGDKPVPGDYDGDGKTDLAVFRPSDGGWYILKSANSGFASYAFGLSGDKPAQADFDNDDKTDIAVYRPSDGYWYLLRSSDGSFHAERFGISADKPIPADYDGDGKADIAVFRPGIGFYFLSSWNNVATGIGDFRYDGTPSAGDAPAPMKRTDAFATHIWRPANGIIGGYGFSSSATIGVAGDIPVVSPFVIE
jgi:hypothetical protein